MQVKYEIHESHAPIWENENWRYAIIMGGRGNGRSGTASRFVLSKLLGKDYIRGAIMRAVHGDIRASCWGELMDRVQEQNLTEEFSIADSDMFIKRGQNSLRAHGFKASSGSLTARLKSLAGYNTIWIEEAEEIGEEEFRILDDSLRTVKGKIRIILTLNTPQKNHWILNKWFNLIPHEEVKGFFTPVIKDDTKNVIHISGTWRENNVNMDEFTIERYGNYKYTNPNYYWQVIEGLSPEQKRGKIFNGWQLIDEIPDEARLERFGEDYGWFPDPACAVAIYYWNGSYIIDELAYGNYLSNDYLSDKIKEVPNNRTVKTIADSSEPKSIEEQKKSGVNIKGSDRAKGSVQYRIKATSQKKIFVTARSKNVWESYENFAWKEDKDGNPLNEPDHTWSHAMDAVTYPIADLHKVTADLPPVYDAPRKRTNVGI